VSKKRIFDVLLERWRDGGTNKLGHCYQRTVGLMPEVILKEYMEHATDHITTPIEVLV
jgi:hypothetical protein